MNYFALLMFTISLGEILNSFLFKKFFHNEYKALSLSLFKNEENFNSIYKFFSTPYSSF